MKTVDSRIAQLEKQLTPDPGRAWSLAQLLKMAAGEDPGEPDGEILDPERPTLVELLAAIPRR